MITTKDPAIAPDDLNTPPADKPTEPPRFYCGSAPAVGESLAPPPLAAGQTVILDTDESRHALRVLRLSVGSRVTLLGGQGDIAAATLKASPGGRALCEITSVRRADPPSPHLTLATAIPKGPRGDTMFNDLAQLGVDVVIPLRTQRSVVDPRDNKLERYQRSAIEACKQSGRAWMMRVQPTLDFAEALEVDAGLILLADPAGQPTSAVAPRLTSVERVRVIVGPEGGLTGAETAAAVAQGAIPWRYNDNILRIETAAAAAVAILRSLA